MTLTPPDRSRRIGIAVAFGALAIWLIPHGSASATAQRVSRPLQRNGAPSRSDDAANRAVRIHNQTGWTMTALYPSSGGDWGGDLLGSRALSSGDSIVVTIDDGSGACRYALRAAFDNGQSLQRDGVNACQVADYYFTR
ncbi:MAG: hypothetical protein V4701_09025 [Pseudomonadota bacterium]